MLFSTNQMYGKFVRVSHYTVCKCWVPPAANEMLFAQITRMTTDLFLNSK